jgi:hypothetical protein
MAKLTDTNTENTLVTAIHDSIDDHNIIVKPCLEKFHEILNEYSNGWYSNAPRTRRPFNMVSRAVDLFLPILASANPKSMVRARLLQLKPYAELIRLTLNHLSEEIKLGETLRQAAFYALMYMGVVKTGISSGGLRVEDAFGYLHDAGQIFCDVVNPEDYFFDVSARRDDEMDFEGDWYFLPYEYIAESGLYENFENLHQTTTTAIKNSGKEITTGNQLKNMHTIKPYVRVADVWIPAENMVMTIPMKGQGTKPLRISEYNGSELGPYTKLRFGTFAESIIPVPPIYVGLDLHYLINVVARKMARQANREKVVLAWEGQAEDDVTNIKSTSDGGDVRVENIDAMKEVKYGGVTDDSYKWLTLLEQKWSEQLRNANLLGGVKSEAETLGQEQMLLANASAAIDDMVNANHLFIKEIFKKFSFYTLTDPGLDVTVSKRFPDLAELEVRVTKDSIENDFWQYNIDVEPYSMQRMNPTIRMRRIMELVNGLILPTLQYAAQQGAVLDVVALVKQVGRDLDLTDSEIDEIYRSVIKPSDSNLGPYAPMKSSAVGDQQGASGASRELNSIQQQNRDGGKPSPPNSNNM